MPQFLVWLVLISATIYAATIMLFLVGLFFPRMPTSSSTPRVSIVIAAKNEAENIPELLNCLRAQSYPDQLLEIIIIDDNSNDNTRQLLRIARQDMTQLRVLSTIDREIPFAFKKGALHLGISRAAGDIIIITDADCRPGPEWVETMVSYFQPDTSMVVGFTGIADDTRTFTRLQALDYLLLMAGAQGTLNLGITWGCSGSNLAYRKTLYSEIGGYQDLKTRVGGDDSLFMQLLRRGTGGKVIFASDPQAWVQTKASRNLAGFLLQRMRWAADANYMIKLNIPFFVIILATFITNLSVLGGLFLIIPGIVSGSLIISLVAIKLLPELLLAIKATQVFQRKYLLKYFPLWFILQIPYVAITGLLSLWGNRFPWFRKR